MERDLDLRPGLRAPVESLALGNLGAAASSSSLASFGSLNAEEVAEGDEAKQEQPERQPQQLEQDAGDDVGAAEQGVDPEGRDAEPDEGHREHAVSAPRAVSDPGDDDASKSR
jgi:hypothetical protein